MIGRRLAFHPYLFALFPTLFLYSRNLREVAIADVLRPVALTLATTLFARVALRGCRIDRPRAAPIISAGIILFFSFGLGLRLTERLGIAEDRSIQEVLTLGCEAIALTVVVVFVLRMEDLARSLNGGLNVSSLALVGLSAVGIVGQGWGGPATRPPDVGPPVEPRVSSAMPGRLPDVYFLVLDAYGRSDVLKELYGFDNGACLDRLERKGFVVARRSRSNYCQTALSLSATLNLRYLDDLAGSRSTSRLPLKRLIGENAVFRAFRDQGYRLVSFASGYDATEGLGVDVTLAPSSNLRAFHSLVADQTPLWFLLGRRVEHDPHRMHRQRILKALDELPAASHPSGSPTFTFAHILAPHPPFVFGADGEDVSAGEGAYSLNDSEGWCRSAGHGGPVEYARRYRDQVTYLTARVEEAVDRILASSPVPPIIVIQGDHGPGSHFDSGSERPNGLRERMGILNACYLPEDARGQIYDAITPINTFRVVLDRCLGSKLGLLEDRSYYSAYPTPYAFIDATDEVDRAGD